MVRRVQFDTARTPAPDVSILDFSDIFLRVSDKVRHSPLDSPPDRPEAGVSDKVLEGCQNKVVPPQEEECEESRSILRGVSRASSRSRGHSKGDRKDLRFPPYRDRYPGGGNYEGKVRNYLIKWGFRTLNDLQKIQQPPPSRDTLATLFIERIRDRAKMWTRTSSTPRGNGIERSTVAALAADAADAVLTQWSRDWIAGRRAAGAAGGHASHGAGGRPKIVTEDAVRQFQRLQEAHPSMTRAEQAAWLGWSDSTLARVVRVSRNSPETLS
jgi:hypothetical protein